VKHPTNEEWMAYLYGESPAARHVELKAHAASCAECGHKVQGWRATMTTLDKSVLPKRRPAPTVSVQWAQWAVAAAIVLFVGFLAGRFTNTSSAEVASLKNSLAQLSSQLETERSTAASNLVATATSAATEEATRLMEEYSHRASAQQAEDQQSVALALKAFDFRLDKLNAELTTVAVNTQSGFKKTQENLIALASASVPSNVDNNSAPRQVQ